MFLLKAIILYITNQTILADRIPPNYDLVNTFKVSNLDTNSWTRRRSLRRLGAPKPPAKAPTNTAKKPPPPPKSKTPTSSKGKTVAEGPKPPPNRNGSSNAQIRNGSSKTGTGSNRNVKSKTPESNVKSILKKKSQYGEGAPIKKVRLEEGAPIKRVHFEDGPAIKRVHFEDGPAMTPKSSKNPIQRIKDKRQRKAEAKQQKKIDEQKAKLDEESFEILYKGTKDLIDYNIFDQHENMRFLHKDTTQYLIELNDWLPTTKTCI